jgi:MFS family permease
MAGEGEFRQGWKIIVAAALGVGTGLSPIPFYTIGVFVRPLSAEFGWSVQQVLAALVFTTLAVLIASPIAGILTDRYGVRRVVLISTIGFGLSFIPFAFNKGSLFFFYANYALVSILGIGTLPITWTKAVNSYFKKSRGLALGLALLLTGGFGSLAKIYANWLVDHYGWRYAYAGLSLFPLLLALPAAFFFLHEKGDVQTPGDAPAVPETGMNLREAIATRAFWTISISLLFLMLFLGGVIPNLERMLMSKGFDSGRAVELAGILGIAVVLGRPVGGWLIDRFWAPAVAFVLLAAPAISFVILGHFTPSAPLAAFSIFLIGFASGVEYDVVAYLVSRYFGMRAYGAIYGCLYCAFAMGSGFGPSIMGAIFTAQKTYDNVLLLGAPVLVVSAALLLTLGKYPVFAARK